MSSKPQRAGALILALVFLVSTLAFTGYVVWTTTRGEDNNDISSNNQTSNESEEGMLKGTNLENYEPRGSVDKLEIIDIKQGTGEEVKEGATVTAHYTGALASSGKIFESSKDSGQPATFGLAQVIQGWQQGVPGMKVGGIRRLIIPAQLAYGAQSPSPDIPANSPLVFDIEMVSTQ